jgi:hypothetical protein
MTYSRGEVVKGPDLLGSSTFRPWVLVSTQEHPFQAEEGLWVAVTTTRRSQAIPLGSDDFISGGLPKTSYASPWNVTTIKMADMSAVEGILKEDVVDRIAKDAAEYMGIGSE